MIAEVILITELLKQTVGTPNSTSKAPSPHFTLPELAPKKVATAYLEASTGRPESMAKKIETGRL